MAEKGKIAWLASYPKSGNTWFRAFLSNLLSRSEIPVNINNLSHSTIASSRQMFDENTGIASSDLKKEEIERLRPYVYDNISDFAKEKVFIKIHDAFTYTTEGRPVVSEKAGYKALYIIRNPLDIVISLAHHLSVPVEIAAENMCETKFAFCQKNNMLPNQLEQRLLSWSEHVLSWTTQKVVPVKIIRYEDMLNDTFRTFADSTAFLEIEADNVLINKAIENSSFTELNRQENIEGFREKAPKAVNFFRQGKANAWKESLSAEIVDKITQAHYNVMKQYNYLP